MTEKRFVFREDYDWWEIKDTTGQIKGDYDEWFSCERVVDLLNTLSDENEQLKEELDYWKKRALLLEKKYNEGDSIKWLRENTVWEQMPSNKRTFTKTTKSDKND